MSVSLWWWMCYLAITENPCSVNVFLEPVSLSHPSVGTACETEDSSWSPSERDREGRAGCGAAAAQRHLNLEAHSHTSCLRSRLHHFSLGLWKLRGHLLVAGLPPHLSANLAPQPEGWRILGKHLWYWFWVSPSQYLGSGFVLASMTSKWFIRNA